MLFLPELYKPQMKDETENSRNNPSISQPVSYIKKSHYSRVSSHRKAAATTGKKSLQTCSKSETFHFY